MTNLIKSIVLSLLILTSSLFGGTIDPLTEDSKYIEYGNKFNFVVSIHGMYKNGTMFAASAVVIDKEWILTAAHVVKDIETCGIHYNNSTVILVDRIITHDDFKHESFGKGDISLCHLRSNLELDFYPSLYSDDNEIGKVCSIVGYGSTGTFLTGAISNDSKKRGGSNVIDAIYDEYLLVCSPSKTTKERRTELEFIIAPGDSGGGLFIDGKLAGINSCVFAEKRSPKSQYGDEAGHTRISKYVSWIKDSIKKK